MNKLANVPVFISGGGLGTLLKEETEFRPKPMVPIGEHPLCFVPGGSGEAEIV
jgi:glucose-1-phosphate cytidylyltransferase